MRDVGIPEFTVQGILSLQLQPVVGPVPILVVMGHRSSSSPVSSTRVCITVSRYRLVDPSGCNTMMVRVSTERPLPGPLSVGRGSFFPSIVWWTRGPGFSPSGPVLPSLELLGCLAVPCRLWDLSLWGRLSHATTLAFFRAPGLAYVRSREAVSPLFGAVPLAGRVIHVRWASTDLCWAWWSSLDRAFRARASRRLSGHAAHLSGHAALPAGGGRG